MNLSLIILTYNQPEALALILKSAEQQSIWPDEVIIADDGSGKETRNLVKSWQKKFPVPLHHVWHKDKGYRITAIRNLAVKKSAGEFLIFSDGDLFFHPRFIEDFKRNMKKGKALIGSRVFLTQSATRLRLRDERIDPVYPLFSEEIEANRLNSIRLPFVNRLLKTLKFSANIRGGLSGIWRKDLESINGWNEEFEGWGLEDTEFIARLFHSGVSIRKIKFQALTYHLWHMKQTQKQASQNQKLLRNTIDNKLIRCKKGLVDYPE